MAENKRGGARPGSGRKKTGLQTKHYTINLPLDIAEAMEKRAAEQKKTVNRYLRDIIEASGQYGNVGLISNKHVDESAASVPGHYVYEVISEKTYVFEENGHQGTKSETLIRRWEPDEESDLKKDKKES